MKKLLLIIASLGFAAAAPAQQYRWTDESGGVRYGDVPPAGVNATRLRPTAPGVRAAETAAPAAKEGDKPLSPEAAFRKRQEDAAKASEKQAKAEQEAREKRENCSRAQNALRSLESGQRIARTDSKGERYFLDDAQVAQDTASARQAAKEWCG
jgi:Domain of unknown function (DUF4124)